MQRINRQLVDRIVVALGIAALIGINLAAWLPQPCPVLRHELTGCTKTGVYTPPLLDAQGKELARIAHDAITTPATFFSTASQDYRAETNVSFYFMAPDRERDYLRLKRDGAYQNVALVTDPLLKNLAWNS